MAGIENYLAPTSVAEAVEALTGGDVVVLAGGTDLMLQLEAKSAATLMNIRRITDLRGVVEDGGQVRVGALTTVSDILGDATVASSAPVLAATADRFASNQIRNMATIGGNICNASPAGDMIIPLLLLDAEVELASWKDSAVRTRSVALADFFTGPGKTAAGSEELLTSVVFKRAAEGFVGAFGKTGPRPALEISMVSVGVGGVPENGGLSGGRVAFGAVAPTPIRGRKAEAALEGAALDDDGLAAVLAAADEDVNPISDVRASDWYRRHLVRVMTEEALQNVANG